MHDRQADAIVAAEDGLDDDGVIHVFGLPESRRELAMGRLCSEPGTGDHRVVFHGEVARSFGLWLCSLCGEFAEGPVGRRLTS